MAHTVYLPPLLTSLASVPQTVGLQSQGWINSHDLSSGFILAFSKDFLSVCLVIQCLQEVRPGHDHLSWWKCPLHVQIAEIIPKGYRLFDSRLLVHWFLSHFMLPGTVLEECKISGLELLFWLPWLFVHLFWIAATCSRCLRVCFRCLYPVKHSLTSLLLTGFPSYPVGVTFSLRFM